MERVLSAFGRFCPQAATMLPATTEDFIRSMYEPDQAYTDKQLHPVPSAPVVGREVFILTRCKDKVVLDIGASGPMHAAIVETAKFCYGIDRPRGDGIAAEQGSGWHNEYVDLDLYETQIPCWKDVELVVCGEVIEHLSNPGWFLERLRKTYSCPVLITVPNAFSDAGRPLLDKKGIENCNVDHVAWYSHRTLKTLLERYGYRIQAFYWYNGRAKFSEGIIVVTE